jgi:hypothetical protein
MITILFAAVLVFSAVVALVDWRRGWLMAIVCGVLQDPARKLTPGTPPIMTLSIVVIYLIIIMARQRSLKDQGAEMMRRFPSVYTSSLVVFVTLLLAAVNGLFTFGMALWKVPALSLFLYLIPIPAIILGYMYPLREQHIVNFLLFYAVITTIALIGTPLEYFNFRWAALGMVALPEGFIRQMTGLEIRLLSGFYRAPDVMGTHAATLAAIGIAMSLRTQMRRAWVWLAVAGWGFFNCIISGRRKATYMVVVFTLVFVWRYIRRLTLTQAFAYGVLVVAMVIVVQKMKSDEAASVYVEGAAITSQKEVWQRLEGGTGATIEQFGFFGAGLGTATQGVRHLTGNDQNVGWQEGGVAKVTMELGVPGLLAATVAGIVLLILMLKISRFPDEAASSQVVRAALFGLVVAHVVNFIVSAQTYSDAVITLLAAFFLGNLLATPALEERAQAALAQETPLPLRTLTQRATA